MKSFHLFYTVFTHKKAHSRRNKEILRGVYSSYVLKTLLGCDIILIIIYCNIVKP